MSRGDFSPDGLALLTEYHWQASPTKTGTVGQDNVSVNVSTTRINELSWTYSFFVQNETINYHEIKEVKRI